MSEQAKPLTKFMHRVKRHPGSDCWEWTAGRTLSGGYGVFYSSGKTVRATRWIWQYLFGPIEDGLLVCHKCDHPWCVNPDHLFLGTDRDNLRDMASKGRHWMSRRTVCARGHPFTPENTLRRGDGGRRCITCQRSAVREACRKARERRRHAVAIGI